MAADGLKAASILRNWGKLARHGACLYYVWLAYAQAGAAGQANGTYQTATQGWYASPGKHPGDRHPPAGVPVWWGPKAGSSAGDVVISLGGGKVVATDYPRYGVVGVCTIDQRERQIGRPYFGWTETMLGAPINYRSGGSPAGDEEDELNATEKKQFQQLIKDVKAINRRVNYMTGKRLAYGIWGHQNLGAKLQVVYDSVKPGETGVRHDGKLYSLVRALYDSIRDGKTGVRTHGTLTAFLRSELGAQKIFRAEQRGKDDAVDVEDLAESLAPLLTQHEADELAAAITKKIGSALSE